ncbi:MAG: tRNA (guanosine(37)-N1)-methyltransferase TrmD [bacterium]
MTKKSRKQENKKSILGRRLQAVGHSTTFRNVALRPTACGLRPKLTFDVLTILPEVITPYTSVSIIGRATGTGLIKVTAHNLRDWSGNNYQSVDDKPFGGGPGMVMRVEPFDLALKAIKAKRGKKTERVILFSAKGKPFTAQDAMRLSKYKRITMLCGRYEGIDERVAENLIDEEICIGPYVLTGGELPALVVIDAVARQIPGVLGAAESLTEESHNTPGVLESAQYTRPAVYKKWKVPEVLMSGDHAKIAEWRKSQKDIAKL